MLSLKSACFTRLFTMDNAKWKCSDLKLYWTLRHFCKSFGTRLQLPVCIIYCRSEQRSSTEPIAASLLDTTELTVDAVAFYERLSVFCVLKIPQIVFIFCKHGGFLQSSQNFWVLCVKSDQDRITKFIDIHHIWTKRDKVSSVGVSLLTSKIIYNRVHLTYNKMFTLGK